MMISRRKKPLRHHVRSYDSVALCTTEVISMLFALPFPLRTYRYALYCEMRVSVKEMSVLGVLDDGDTSQSFIRAD